MQDDLSERPLCVAELMQSEREIAHGPASGEVGRSNPCFDSDTTCTRVIHNERKRLDALGGTTCRGAAAAGDDRQGSA